MLISIIIPTFAHKEYVLECINSVLQQDYKQFEVIVVDDGSSDGTSAILQPLISSGAIRYVRQVNQGMSAARNNGAAIACGDALVFLDDDDKLPSNRLSWQASFLKENHGCIAVFGQAVLFHSSQTIPIPFKHQKLTEEVLLSGNKLMSPGQGLIRTQAFKAVKGFDTTTWGADDFDLWFKLVKLGTICCLNQPALFYRLHTGNASKDSSKMLRNTKKVFYRFLKTCPPSKRKKAAYAINVSLARSAAHHWFVVFKWQWSKPIYSSGQLSTIIGFWLRHARLENYRTAYEVLRSGTREVKKEFRC